MDNRARILSCAIHLFADRGYEAVGVQEIVDAAGITKPTLYHYFGSKLGLLNTLLEERYQEFFQKLEAAAFYQGDVTLTLERATSTYFAFANEQPDFYRMQLGFWFAPPFSQAFQAMLPWNKRQQTVLEGIFSQVVQQHGNMRGRQVAYSATFLGMVNTYIGLSLHGSLSLDQELTYRAVHQFMHGIFSWRDY